MKFSVDSDAVSKASIPMDLFTSNPNLAFDFKLEDLKKVAPEIISEKKIESIEYTITSESDLINAAKKFRKLNSRVAQ